MSEVPLQGSGFRGQALGFGVFDHHLFDHQRSEFRLMGLLQ